MILKPMLADEMPVEAMVGLADDDGWAFQAKYNGHRVLFSVVDGGATVIGRNGQVYQHNATFRRGAWATAFGALPDCVLDGELLGVNDGGAWTVWLFDLVHLESEWADVTPSDTFSRRAEVLAELYRRWSPPSDLFGLAPTAVDKIGKLNLGLEQMRTGGEGVMARRLTGQYSPGRRSPQVVKLKFIHDADLVIDSLRFEGRNNVVLVAFDEHGHKIEVGRASANGKGQLAKDDVVVVRYNYMSKRTPSYPNGRLVGPRIITRRTDKEPAECTTAQLVYTDKEPVFEH